MAPAEPPSAATVWLRIGTTLETSATRGRGSLCAAAIAARSPAPPPPTTTTSVWTDCIASLPGYSGRYDRDLPYPCAPLPRAALVDRVSVRVHRDRHRHILHLELVDRLHAEILEGDDARRADRLGDEIGRAPDRDQVDALVLADHLHRVGAALRFSDRAEHAGRSEHGVHELVHAARGRGTRGSDDFIAHRVHRADVVDQAVGQVHRQLLAFGDEIGEALVRSVAAGDDLAVEQ